MLTLRDERRQRVSENRILRKTFGPKRDEVTGVWRRLHNWEPNDLYSSPNVVFFFSFFSFFLLAQQPNSGLGRHVVEVSRSQTQTHTPSRTPLIK